MQITTDDKSGCCHGVVRAIERAEQQLLEEGTLLSLGAIVHNGTELARLREKGLKIIDYSELETLHDCTVLFRAHGEPPAIYSLSHKNNIKIIDCTCPVVLKLQQTIANTYNNIKANGGQIVIFGKNGHAEVNGLVGQVDGNAFVVESRNDISRLIAEGELSVNQPIAIFSQTTKDPAEYRELCDFLISMVEEKGANVTVFDTICRQVSSRHQHLIKFAKQHSVVIFVSGRDSSNGKVLFELCRGVNSRTYMIEHISEIDPKWFRPDDSVGICGATSTPKWQIEEVAKFLSTIFVS